MYCIAICDDEKQILNQIHTKVKACFEKEDVPAEYLCFDDARALMELLEKQYVDILFLDIDMPYFSGMDIAGFLLEKKIKTIIVFVTSHDALVYQSFAYKPFGFIRKTYMDEELPELAERIRCELNDRKQEITVTRRAELVRILIRDIVYIEAEGNYLEIYTETDSINIRETMTHMEDELKYKGFLRCHKGYLVNSEFVIKINSAELVVRYGATEKVIPIGRSYEKELRKNLLQLIRD